MKATRTNFVVDYKSPRRQAKPGSSSIWGNLDLKAIASKVESDVGDVPTEGDHGVIVTAAPDIAPPQLAETAECPKPNLLAADLKMPQTNSIGKRTKGNTRAELTPRSASIAVELVDDLDALTRENNQLKAFLREKLTTENAQLKALLTRYK